METQKKFFAAGYCRISNEETKKAESEESNSIQNQRLLILEYVNRNPEINLTTIENDDGYSGVNFQRPGFLKLLELIRLGKINCVIVKDLSRFGRNYVATGRYLQQLFPRLGVRFISINDNYDSQREEEIYESILLPFKNLMNDAFSRDISLKVRSQLAQKRRQGEYTGAFAPYGYVKSETNKNKLVPDLNLTGVVEQIYGWRLEGFGCEWIAKALNDLQVPSPMAYKKEMGFSYECGFSNEEKPSWNPVSVRRILKNPVYAGHLIQGDRCRVSYKIPKEMKPEAIMVENTHQPLISRGDFDRVSRLMNTDTRGGTEGRQYPLSGLVFCSHCQKPMIRKKVGNAYVYYLCSCYGTGSERNKKNQIKEEVLLNSLVRFIKTQLSPDVREEVKKQFPGTKTSKIERLEELSSGSMSLTRTLLLFFFNRIEIQNRETIILHLNYRRRENIVCPE